MKKTLFICLFISFSAHASLCAQMPVIYSPDSLSGEAHISKADYITGEERVWTLQLPQGVPVKVTRVNNVNLSYAGELLIDAVTEMLPQKNKGEFSEIITGAGELNFVLNSGHITTLYEDKSPIIIIKFAKITTNGSSETMVHEGDFELSSGILKTRGHTNYLGSKVSAMLGGDYASYTVFGGVNGGRIRGSNQGYLVLEGNPDGYGNPTIYMNRYVSNGNIIMTASSGKVGIGVDVPQSKLHVEGDIRATNNFWGRTKIVLQDHTHFTVSPSVIPGLTNSFSMPHYGIASPYVDTSADLWLSGYHAMHLFTDGTPRMSIDRYGKVGIGTVNPQYLLDVKGIIRATEVKIEHVDNFPDYVFSQGYKLRPLMEVSSFIKANGHLPEIPSAQEVKENGINLLEMNKKLLRKVEELTLYAIEQQQRIEEQQRQIDQLRKKLE